MPTTLQIKKKSFIIYLLLCLTLGLFIGGVGGAFSLYHYFFKTNAKQQFMASSNHIRRLFKHIDRAPKDNIISQQELQTFGKKTFLYLDDDKDQLLSLSEIPKRFQRSWGKDFLTVFNNKQHISEKQFLQHFNHFFQQKDANKDNQITLEELQQGLQKRLFKKLDTDNNNALSLQEFLAHHSKHNNHRKHRKRKNHKNKETE